MDLLGQKLGNIMERFFDVERQLEEICIGRYYEVNAARNAGKSLSVEDVEFLKTYDAENMKLNRERERLDELAGETKKELADLKEYYNKYFALYDEEFNNLDDE